MYTLVLISDTESFNVIMGEKSSSNFCPHISFLFCVNKLKKHRTCTGEISEHSTVVDPQNYYNILINLREKKLLFKIFCPKYIFLIWYIQTGKIYPKAVRLKLRMLKIIKMF